MEKEKQLIPQLRFPEFEDDWKKCKIGDTFKLFNGYAFSSSDSLNSDGALWVKIADVGIDKMKTDNLSYLPYEYVEKYKKFILSEGDYVIALTRPILSGNLKIARIDKYFNNSLLNQRVAKLITDNNSSFIYNLLKGDRLIKSIENNIAGSDPPNLSPNDINHIKINIPQLPEQQKIASFLTAIDAKITKLTKKKALLAQYKKGVMQKIFKQEIRFKDDNGNMFPDWEEKKLGVIGSIVSGLTYSPNDINENGVLVLRSSNVKKRLIALNDNVFVNIEEGKFNPVELNDILICVRNGSKRLIGKNAIIKEEHIGLAFGAFMTVYRSEYNRFLFHFFDSQYYKKEVHKNLGATINSINGGDLKKFKVPFPCIAEQTKIANFLSAIDLKIEALNNKIENSKNFKKGLLQQMFV